MATRWPFGVGATVRSAAPLGLGLRLGLGLGLGVTVRSAAPSSSDCSPPPRAPASPAARWRRTSATARPEEPLAAGSWSTAASSAARALLREGLG